MKKKLHTIKIKEVFITALDAKTVQAAQAVKLMFVNVAYKPTVGIQLGLLFLLPFSLWRVHTFFQGTYSLGVNSIAFFLASLFGNLQRKLFVFNM